MCVAGFCLGFISPTFPFITAAHTQEGRSELRRFRQVFRPTPSHTALFLNHSVPPPAVISGVISLLLVGSGFSLTDVFVQKTGTEVLHATGVIELSTVFDIFNPNVFNNCVKVILLIDPHPVPVAYDLDLPQYNHFEVVEVDAPFFNDIGVRRSGPVSVEINILRDGVFSTEALSGFRDNIAGHRHELRQAIIQYYLELAQSNLPVGPFGSTSRVGREQLRDATTAID